MNILEAKQISIVEYLKQLGYQPTKSKCGQYWFKSPFRSERTASFKVDNNKNDGTILAWPMEVILSYLGSTYSIQAALVKYYLY